jgi:2-oxoisovalerate dehydrogenase E1 component beta subunit
MAAYGLRPVVEIQFADYFYPASDQIVSEAARLRYRSAGEFTAAMTIRMPCGGGIYGGQTHSQSPEAMFTHVCGLRTVMPSNPYDAKGLLISCIENDDPVIFLEPKRLYNGPFDGHHDQPLVPWSQHPLGEVPEGYYTVPLESATVFRPGADLTVISYGTRVFVCEAAARETGIDAEIIDLRSLWPLDLEAIVTSVKKTRRCVVVHEATRTCGFGAELLSLVQEHCFYHLEAPIERGRRRGRRGTSALQIDANQFRADGQRLPDLAAEREHGPRNGRRNLDRGLFGHHVGQHLVFGDQVAGGDAPGDELDLGDAFAEIGHADDMNAHRRAHGSIARRNAAATRAGPGK